MFDPMTKAAHNYIENLPRRQNCTSRCMARWLLRREALTDNYR